MTAAAEELGYPVVLKTDEPRIQHKSDVGGVVLGIGDVDQLVSAYADLAARLGPRALVCQSVPTGVELALGIVADPELGPLVVVGAGGVLVELLADRRVALPPVSSALAADLLADLRVRPLLDGVRGARPADLGAVIRAIRGVSELAMELGSQLEALDINPLICGPRRRDRRGRPGDPAPVGDAVPTQSLHRGAAVPATPAPVMAVSACWPAPRWPLVIQR